MGSDRTDPAADLLYQLQRDRSDRRKRKGRESTGWKRTETSGDKPVFLGSTSAVDVPKCLFQRIRNDSSILLQIHLQKRYLALQCTVSCRNSYNGSLYIPLCTADSEIRKKEYRTCRKLHCTRRTAFVFPQSVQLPWTVMSCLARAVGLAPLNAVVFGMIGDVVEFGQWKTHVRQKSLIFAGGSIGTKVGAGDTDPETCTVIRRNFPWKMCRCGAGRSERLLSYFYLRIG